MHDEIAELNIKSVDRKGNQKSLPETDKLSKYSEDCYREIDDRM
jgi:hypothetical protein